MALKKIILTFAWLLFVAGRMEASLVTFDNLSPTPEGTLVPNGYAGLRWTNFYALNGITYVGGDSGYRRGVISGQKLVDNGYGKPARASRPWQSATATYKCEPIRGTSACISRVDGKSSRPHD